MRRKNDLIISVAQVAHMFKCSLLNSQSLGIFDIKAVIFWSCWVHKLLDCARDTKSIMFDTPYSYVVHEHVILINFLFCQSAIAKILVYFDFFLFLADSLW